MPSQPRRAAQDGRKPYGAILILSRAESPQRAAEGRRASTSAPRQQDSTTGGGRSVTVPRLESMVKPRSLGERSTAGQAAGGQGLPPFCLFYDF